MNKMGAIPPVALNANAKPSLTDPDPKPRKPPSGSLRPGGRTGEAVGGRNLSGIQGLGLLIFLVPFYRASASKEFRESMTYRNPTVGIICILKP